MPNTYVLVSFIEPPKTVEMEENCFCLYLINIKLFHYYAGDTLMVV